MYLSDRYLCGRRGHQVHNGELVRGLGLDPENTKNLPNVLSGALNRVGEANKATGLQLPYEAVSGWSDFLGPLGESAAALRQCVVVTDACQMLKHEDADLWHEAVDALHGGPHCLGGGWSTLVLVDDAYGWDNWELKPRPLPEAEPMLGY